MITLSQKKGWQERLPEGLAALTERLILAADVLPYNTATLRLAKRPWAVRMSELGEMLQPGTFDGLGERKLFMNEQVLAAIQAGASQVLVVGAGFDTLCLRLAPLFPLVRFVEVDHPATAAAKRKGVEQEGRPGNMTMIAVDLGETALSVVLADCEVWDPDRQSVVIAEGLLLYLSADAVQALFREVDTCTGAHSRVAFSHLVDFSRHGLARAVLRLYREPWLSSSRRENLPAYVGSGWDIVATGAGRPRRDLEGFAVVEKSAN
jgi:methyltransferase (TIGR00027 family)